MLTLVLSIHLLLLHVRTYILAIVLGRDHLVALHKFASWHRCLSSAHYFASDQYLAISLRPSLAIWLTLNFLLSLILVDWGVGPRSLSLPIGYLLLSFECSRYLPMVCAIGNAVLCILQLTVELLVVYGLGSIGWAAKDEASSIPLPWESFNLPLNSFMYEMLILAIFWLRHILHVLVDLDAVVLQILAVWLLLLLEGMLVRHKVVLVELELLGGFVNGLGAFLSLAWQCEAQILRGYRVASWMKLLHSLG